MNVDKIVNWVILKSKVPSKQLYKHKELITHLRENVK